MNIKVMLFEDNEGFRESLVQTLKEEEGIELSAAFENCEGLKESIRLLQPDVVLMDIDMPGVGGIEGVKIMSRHFQNIPVIMLTVFDDDKTIFEAICNGASGYILKKSSPEKIISAVKDAVNGGAPITSSIAKRILSFLPKVSDTAVNDALTAREAEILSWLVKGHSYKMIANEIHISIDTIRTHIKKIYQKLHVNSATEAVSKAIKNRLI